MALSPTKLALDEAKPWSSSVGTPAPAQPTIGRSLAQLLGQLDPIELGEVKAANLLNRVDTKFVLCEWQLRNIVEAVGDRYRVLNVQGTRINRYRTLYFDTPGFGLYLQHHNDAGNRHKVRCRQYVDSNLYFLEVKFKTNKRRTVKSRLPLPGLSPVLAGEAERFVQEHCPLDASSLLPNIWNSFMRITLVNQAEPERITLDIDFRYGWNERCGGLPGIAIAEVKQKKFSLRSEFIQQLRAHNIRQTGFSKYCAGIADIYPHLKSNRFKRRSLLVERLSRLRG